MGSADSGVERAPTPVARRSLMPSEELRRLTARSATRATLAIVRQWAIVAVAVALAARTGTWWSYAAGIVVVATRQHALAVLVHDGAHHLLYRNARWNDVVSDVALAFPLFVSTRLYRRQHLVHHRLLNTDGDPDLDLVSATRTPREWMLIALGDVTGANLVLTRLGVVDVVGTAGQSSFVAALGKRGRETRAWLGRGQLVGFGAFAAASALALTLTGAWKLYLLLWALPAMTVLNLVFRLRGVAEHVACESTDELNGSRTVLAPLPERWLLAPCNINYHLEHHLFPGVPHFNLRRLYRRLAVDDEYRGRATTSRSYVLGPRSVLAEVVRAGRSTIL